MKRLLRGAAHAAAAVALTLALTVPSKAQTVPQYRVSRTVPLGAPDRWDYVVFDPASHRVYVAHGDRVTVVDGRDGRILGQVAGFTGGTHGIAIATASGRGYTDDGRAGEAASFDLKTLKPQKRIKAGADADAVAFDRASGHIFVINGDPGTVTVIDPKTDSVVATVETGGKLEFAVAGENGKLYVNGEQKREIVRIDTRANLVDARWPIRNCDRPHGLAMDVANHRLFSSCLNNVLMVVNSDSGATVATLPIGSGTDAAAFDPKRKRVFSSNGRDGNLSVIEEKDPQTFVALGNIATAPTARTMSLDPDTGRIYLVAADLDEAASGTGASGRAAHASGAGPGGSPNAPRPRIRIVPGSLRLLFLDPAP